MAGGRCPGVPGARCSGAAWDFRPGGLRPGRVPASKRRRGIRSAIDRGYQSITRAIGSRDDLRGMPLVQSTIQLRGRRWSNGRVSQPPGGGTPFPGVRKQCVRAGLGGSVPARGEPPVRGDAWWRVDTSVRGIWRHAPVGGTLLAGRARRGSRCPRAGGQPQGDPMKFRRYPRFPHHPTHPTHPGQPRHRAGRVRRCAASVALVIVVGGCAGGGPEGQDREPGPPRQPVDAPAQARPGAGASESGPTEGPGTTERPTPGNSPERRVADPEGRDGRGGAGAEGSGGGSYGGDPVPPVAPPPVASDEPPATAGGLDPSGGGDSGGGTGSDVGGTIGDPGGCPEGEVCLPPEECPSTSPAPTPSDSSSDAPSGAPGPRPSGPSPSPEPCPEVSDS